MLNLILFDGDWGLGIGDWGFGGWAPNPTTKTQNPKTTPPRFKIFFFLGGFGVWVVGWGGRAPPPTPQTPNPQSPIPNPHYLNIF